MKTHPFNHSNTAILESRIVVQEYVEAMQREGRLSEVTQDEHAVVSFLARTSLAKYVVPGLVRASMIERWLSEALATASLPIDVRNILTGQFIYCEWAEIREREEKGWCDLTMYQQDRYNQLAAALMDHLNLCYGCGQQQVAIDLEERDGLMLCPDCRGGA